MLHRRYYPHGETGEVRIYLDHLRRRADTKKAAVKLDIDLQTLEEFWPDTLNVTVKTLRGWEPLRELIREFNKIAYRILFCVKGKELWLLSAFEKESADTPKRELEKAYRRMQEVLES